MIKAIIAAILLASQLSPDYPVEIAAPAVEVVEDISIYCRYSYNQLQSPAEMEVYNTLLEGITTHSPVVYLDNKGFSKGQLESIALAVASDNPELFWFEGNIDCPRSYDVEKVLPCYNLTAKEIDEYRDELTKAIDDRVAELSAINSEYFRLQDAYLGVYNTKYSNTGDLLERCPVGTMLNDSSLCAGKTQSLAWIYHELGFNTVYRIAKMTTGSFHVWLAVEFRGQWYNVDPTYGEFLLSDDDLIEIEYLEDTIPVPRTKTYTFDVNLDSF